MSKLEYEPHYRKSKALIVGINSYTNLTVHSLYEAENDAEAVATLLKTPEYGFEIKILVGRRATKKAILEALYKLRSTAPDDRILIYFACHGYIKTDNFGNERGFIAVTDTDPHKEFTALSLEEITDIRFNAGAKHIAFIFDTCFSGQALGLTRVISQSSDKLLTRRAYQVISAGAGDQTVSDFRSMTTFMVAGIKNKEAASYGLVTLNTLGLYLQQTIASDTSQTQIPQFGHLKGSQGGDFILSIGNLQQIAASTTAKSNFSIQKPPTKTTQNFPQKGIYTAEVDLIGRIDSVTQSTVLSISAGLSVSLIISSSDKMEVIQRIRDSRPKWGATRIHVLLYTDLLYLLLKNHIEKLDFVTIDKEYSGYESIIKARLLDLLRKDGKYITKDKIRFRRIEKTSPARLMATRVFSGKALPDWRVSAEELLSTQK